MKRLPAASGLLICENVVIEEGTKNVTKPPCSPMETSWRSVRFGSWRKKHEC